MAASPFVPMAAASEPVQVTAGPGLRLDDGILKQAVRDSEKGGLWELFKSAGRLGEIEPLHEDKLAKAMAGAAKRGLLANAGPTLPWQLLAVPVGTHSCRYPQMICVNA